MLLQRKIDDVLEGVHLSDLLMQESEVRTRVGLVGLPSSESLTRARCRSSSLAHRALVRAMAGRAGPAARKAAAFVDALFREPDSSGRRVAGTDGYARRRRTTPDGSSGTRVARSA